MIPVPTKIQYFKNPENIYKNIYPIRRDVGGRRSPDTSVVMSEGRRPGDIENGREINVYKYVDCIFTGINLYYPNVLMSPGLVEEHLILPVIEKTMSLNQSTIYETPEYGMKYDFQLSEEYTTYEEPVFFFVYNTDNYFHFLYDSLPYLISFLNIRQEIPNIKLLMQYPNSQKREFYPFVLEFLEILGIKMSDIILINDKTRYNSVYISTSYTHDIDSNLPPRKEIYDFYRQMADDVVRMYISVPTPPKIYVSRRTYIHNKLDNIGTNYTTRRRLVNEDELVSVLSKQGFVEVFTENLTTIEKILYFANATHVVGAIGGGISNVLFSPKTTKLEAIVSPTFLDVNKRFRYSLDCVDVVYNHNTKHVEEGEYKRYMRVKQKDGEILGEIEEVREHTVIVSYQEGFHTGWNSQMKYKQIEFKKEDIISLDKGLNSPYTVMIR